MKKTSLIIVLSILTLVVSACSPKVAIPCGEGSIEVRLNKAQEAYETCALLNGEDAVEKETPEMDTPPIDTDENSISSVEEKVSFNHLRYEVWDDFDEPLAEVVRGPIVFGHDDYGNSQLFYGCSHDEIVESLDLKAVWAIYFNIYEGEASPTQVHSEVEENLNEDEIAEALGWETWELFSPSVVNCNN